MLYWQYPSKPARRDRAQVSAASRESGRPTDTGNHQPLDEGGPWRRSRPCRRSAPAPTTRARVSRAMSGHARTGRRSSSPAAERRARTSRRGPGVDRPRQSCCAAAAQRHAEELAGRGEVGGSRRAASTHTTRRRFPASPPRRRLAWSGKGGEDPLSVTARCLTRGSGPHQDSPSVLVDD